MLFADKRALQTTLKVELMEIREKELRFYTNNTLAIGMQSAFFAGFSSTALMTSVSRQPLLLHALYLLCTIAGLGLQLGVMLSTSLLAMIAPGLALRGPDGSMNVAVDHMIGEYRSAFTRLLLGIVALHGSTICFVLLQLPAFEAVLLSLCILTSLHVIIRYIRKLMVRFQLPADATVTGKYEAAEAARAGAGAGLRDSGEIATVSHLIKDQTHLQIDPSVYNRSRSREDVAHLARHGVPLPVSREPSGSGVGGEIVE